MKKFLSVILWSIVILHVVVYLFALAKEESTMLWPYILIVLLVLVIIIKERSKRQKLKKRNEAITMLCKENGMSTSNVDIVTLGNSHCALAIDSASKKLLTLKLDSRLALIHSELLDFDFTHVISNMSFHDLKTNAISPKSLFINEKESKLLIISFYKDEIFVRRLDFSEVLSAEIVKDSRTVTVGGMTHAGTGIGSLLIGASTINTISQDVTLSFQIKIITRIISDPYFMFDIYCKSHKRSVMTAKMTSTATELISVLSIIIDKGNKNKEG